MSDFVVVCGLSGAGRSAAAAHLEDLGWFVIDNVPPSLIPKVGELAAAQSARFGRVALVVRGQAYEQEVARALEDLRAMGLGIRVLFLEADTPVLVRRYEDTRRRHPLAEDGASVGDAIERERKAFGGLRAMASVVIDTTQLNVHDLRDRIRDLFEDGDDDSRMRVNIVSFGYKHGLPIDVDMVLDLRFLPNPHWVDELRPLTGLDEPVREYVLEQPEVGEFLARLESLLGLLLPGYVKEGKSYLSIAVGCTGGRHRSVALAPEIATLVRKHGFEPSVTHRDVER
jgi:UPF0042 nucleotide-binding protein